MQHKLGGLFGAIPGLGLPAEPVSKSGGHGWNGTMVACLGVGGAKSNAERCGRRAVVGE